MASNLVAVVTLTVKLTVKFGEIDVTFFTN